ncbi:hypothetical protein [Streptomyces spiralis]|uniref:hypothetical protein n=1 Tax=Streptomyces spiralis TaxID=66376 RepID=UPI00368C9BE4
MLAPPRGPGTSAATHCLSGRTPTPRVLAQAQLHSFTTAFWWSAAVFALGLVCVGPLYRTRKASAPAAQNSEEATAIHL